MRASLAIWLLLCGQAVAAGAPPVPSVPVSAIGTPLISGPNNRVLAMGDSLICFATFGSVSSCGDAVAIATPGTQSLAFASNGLMSWVQFLTGGRIVSEITDNRGIVGQTSTQILARIPAALAAKRYGAVVLDMGENDPLSAITVAQTVANMQAAVALFQAVGAKVILLPVFPRGPGAWNTGSTPSEVAYQQQAAEINAQYAAFAKQTPGVYWADARKSYIDTTTGYAATVNTIADKLHNSPAGAYLWGSAVAAIINQIFPAVDPSFADPLDTYTTAHPTGNLAANGLLTGSVAATTNGVMSGVQPTSWTATNSLGTTTGGTAVWSLIADAVAGQCAVLTLTGVTGTNTSGEIFLLQSITNGSNINPGDVIESMVNVTVTGGSNIRGVGIHVKDSDGTTVFDHYSLSAYNVAGYPLPAAFSGLTKTPQTTTRTPAGTASYQLRLSVIGDTTASGGVSGVVKFCRMSTRKVLVAAQGGA
jgi:lysophospholipase L1-like esterase